MDKKITLQDIAAVTGVSIQTVSRVMNDKPDVARETRQRVLEAATQLGYPSPFTRGAVTASTNILGLVSSSVSDPNIAQVLAGAEREARSRGYLFLLTLLKWNSQQVLDTCDLLVERDVQGIYGWRPELRYHTTNCLDGVSGTSAAVHQC